MRNISSKILVAACCHHDGASSMLKRNVPTQMEDSEPQECKTSSNMRCMYTTVPQSGAPSSSQDCRPSLCICPLHAYILHAYILHACGPTHPQTLLRS